MGLLATFASLPIFIGIELIFGNNYQFVLPEFHIAAIIITFLIMFVICVIILSALTAILYRLIVRFIPIGYVYIKGKQDGFLAKNHTFKMRDVTALSICKILVAITLVQFLAIGVIGLIATRNIQFDLINTLSAVMSNLMAGTIMVVLQMILVLPLARLTFIGQIKLEHGSKKKPVRGSDARNYYKA